MINTSKRAEIRRQHREIDKGELLPTTYVSPVKDKPRELAWKLYKQSGTKV